MKNAQKNIWIAAACILVGLILSVWFGKEYAVYQFAEIKVSEEAFPDESHPPVYSGSVDAPAYRVTWALDVKGAMYTFETKEDHYPEQNEKKYVRGYIDEKNRLTIVSYNGDLGAGSTIFIGPLLAAGGIAGVIISLKNYKKRKEDYEKEKAVIDERLATAEQFDSQQKD